MLQRVVDELSTWSPPLEEIVPVNYGELFCNDWVSILSIISSTLPNTRIVLPTNGSLLKEPVVGVLAGIRTLKLIRYAKTA